MATNRDGQSAGAAILDDLRVGLSRDEIARQLARYGTGKAYDPATRKLIAATGGQADLSVEAHRVAVIGWLRAWGCRHLRRADTARTSEALRLWWEAWAGRLPRAQETLTGLNPAALAAAGEAFDALRAAPAASRNVEGREVGVAFGDTAAAKLMFAIRPDAFLPWDEQIRRGCGWPGGGGAAYVMLLQLAAAALDGLARRLGAPVSDLPELLGRPGSSPPKLVDEFLLVRISGAPV